MIIHLFQGRKVSSNLSARRQWARRTGKLRRSYRGCDGEHIRIGTFCESKLSARISLEQARNSDNSHRDDTTGSSDTETGKDTTDDEDGDR